MRKQIVAALLLVVIVGASGVSWFYGETRYEAGRNISFDAGYKQGINEASNIFNNISFTPQELQKFQSIKHRIEIYDAPPYPGQYPLEWISMRNSSSHEYYYLKSMEYLCFQGHEWEAVVSIHNALGSITDYVVEVSRFTWNPIQVKLDGIVVADFPQVTNNTTSLGYTTFTVKV